jgi:hypothetical protein
MIIQFKLSIQSATPSKTMALPPQVEASYGECQLEPGTNNQYIYLSKEETFVTCWAFWENLLVITLKIQPDKADGFVAGDVLEITIVKPDNSKLTTIIRVTVGSNAYGFVYPQAAWQLRNLEEHYLDAYSWSKEFDKLAKPRLFSISACNITDDTWADDTWALGITLRSPNILKARLKTLCETIFNLGFNTAELGDWARQDKSTSASIMDVNAIAATAGITARIAAFYQPLVGLGIKEDPGVGLEGDVYGSLIYSDILLAALDNTMNPAIPTKSIFASWVAAMAVFMERFMAAPNQNNLQRVAISDEPSWPASRLFECLSYDNNSGLPATMSSLASYLNKHGLAIGDFRQKYLAYLQFVDADSNYFGFTNWRDVAPPLELTHHPMNNLSATLNMRRLYYWSMRFGHDQATKAWERIARVMTTEIRGTSGERIAFKPFVNYRGNLFYISCLNSTMYCDWFEDGRANARLQANNSNTLRLTTEDWSYVGAYLYKGSATADLLKSAGQAGGIASETGVYITPNATDLNPDAIVYRLFSFVARGSKSFDYFTYGPYPVAGDSFSNGRVVYPQIALAHHILANAEPVLYPAIPAGSNIAIIITTSSDYLTNDSGYALFQMERSGLHCALSHAGYEVDYLDETSVAEGKLSQYQVAYLTDPALVEFPIAGDRTKSVYIVIQNWVEQGGVLALVAGAAVMDETGAPINNFINQLTGLQARPDFAWMENDKVRRPLKQEHFGLSADNLLGHEIYMRDATNNLIEADNMGAIAAVAPLIDPNTNTPYCPLVINSNGANIVLRFHHPTSREIIANAIVNHPFGAGQVFSYAFFPGIQYISSAKPLLNFQETIMPNGWQASLRGLALQPVAAAGLTPRVEVQKIDNNQWVDTLVEAKSLASDKGTAIVLFNWNGVEASPTKLEVPAQDIKVSMLLSRTLCQRFVVKSSRTGQALNFTETLASNISWSEGLYRLVVSLTGFTTVDVLTIEIQSSALAKTFLPKDKNRSAGPWRRITGGNGDGGGIYVGSNGKIIKIPPRVDKV